MFMLELFIYKYFLGIYANSQIIFCGQVIFIHTQLFGAMLTCISPNFQIAFGDRISVIYANFAYASGKTVRSYCDLSELLHFCFWGRIFFAWEGTIDIN